MVIVTLLSCALFGIFARMRHKPVVQCIVLSKVLVLIHKLRQ